MANDDTIAGLRDLLGRLQRVNDDDPWIAGAYDKDVTTLNAAIAALEQWRPIETAPKNQVIDLWVMVDEKTGEGVRKVNCYWEQGRWIGFSCLYQYRPTHWMPLPAAPDPEQKDKDHE